ncbi:hypothetical protein EG68_03995 [Paragonimus skrjabini miyazakii]|uniref:Uncharacterized protein n=1 Tax=Paragonimus skrjabini miyazakii TaxID=59628 RepID=A0A8S9Z551_9TREM|nr:hypothetical protein EG68_03995 [Paragonimus skrjabini miyazakii]
MNDQEFYDAFKRSRQPMPLNISPETFEEIIRRDHVKREFISKFTNIYEDVPPYRPSVDMRQPAVRESVPIRRSSPPHPQTPPRYSTYEDSAVNYHPERITVLFSNMDKKWEPRVIKYLDQHWKSNACFASIYPILLKLEQNVGPGWRVDKIGSPRLVQNDAVPDSTLNFQFSPDRQIYSVWRQRVREF